MNLTINPEWDAAPFALHVVMANGQDCGFLNHHAPRFREQDKNAAIKAMTEHDSATLNKLAIRKYIEA